MKLIKGASYTRDEISSILGGSKQSFLPDKDGEVVCGCFNPKYNPDAPEIVIVTWSGDSDEGPGVHRVSELMIRQRGSIPVFLKEKANRWVYQGRHQLKNYLRHEHDPETVQEHALRANRTHGDLLMFFESEGQAGDDAIRSYLLTWNPNRWSWDGLEQLALMTADGEVVVDSWSCGRNKHIERGSRLYLLRQGVEPRGIMGSGHALSMPSLRPHWDESRKKEGNKALMLDVAFDRLLSPDHGDEPLAVTDLKIPELNAVNWNTQSSGIEISSGADRLEDLWQTHLSEIDSAIHSETDLEGFEGELRSAYRRHRQREQKLRKAKIRQEMQANGGRLRCTVPHCNFDFVERYGEIGVGFAHVHHLKPLHDRTVPSRTKLADLAIVCPNCHAMIHQGGECRDMETLIKKTRRGG